MGRRLQGLGRRHTRAPPALVAAYNRKFRGYVAPSYSVESLPIARWKKDGPRLHPHQVAGARRVLSNGGGMVAFDVGVGQDLHRHRDPRPSAAGGTLSSVR
ncbi:MAG: hypothetical protein IPG17_29195 [Sandaracinaceae bacterium]|nr:hypothetical protein [Sandaracinaceae bacterium]